MITVLPAEGKTIPELARVLEPLLGVEGTLVFHVEARGGQPVVGIRFPRAPNDIRIIKCSGLARRMSIQHDGPSH